MPKRTFQPSKRRRSRRLGFLKRAKEHAKVINRRRQKGRSRVTPTI